MGITTPGEIVDFVLNVMKKEKQKLGVKYLGIIILMFFPEMMKEVMTYLTVNSHEYMV